MLVPYNSKSIERYGSLGNADIAVVGQFSGSIVMQSWMAPDGQFYRRGIGVRFNSNGSRLQYEFECSCSNEALDEVKTIEPRDLVLADVKPWLHLGGSECETPAGVQSGPFRWREILPLIGLAKLQSNFIKTLTISTPFKTIGIPGTRCYDDRVKTVSSAGVGFPAGGHRWIAQI
jgi:hypothetical protein